MDDQIEIQVRGAVYRNKFRRLQITVQTDKAYFELSDVLVRHAGFPTVERFLEEGLPGLLQDYLSKARSVVAPQQNEPIRNRARNPN